MAKKKSKKSAQKQVEVASPPDNVEPASAVATEESPANEATPEAQEPSLAPLLAAHNDPVPAGPTSMPDPNLEQHTQAEPRENEVLSIKDEAPPPLEPDHVDTTLTPPELDHTVPAAEPEEPSLTQEADAREVSSTQSLVIEAIEPSDVTPIDVTHAQLDATSLKSFQTRTKQPICNQCSSIMPNRCPSLFQRISCMQIRPTTSIRLRLKHLRLLI
jgi:hypothetical protein